MGNTRGSFVVLGGGVWFVSIVVSTARGLIHAENSLNATALVCDLIGDCVERSGYTRWPSSWADLEPLPARDRVDLLWPRDAAKIRAMVRVDFTLSLDEVRRQKSDEFTAIQHQPGPYYSMQPGITALLERISRRPGGAAPRQ